MRSMERDETGVHYSSAFRRPSSAREQELAKLYMRALTAARDTGIVICSVCPLHDVDYTELGLTLEYNDDYYAGLEALAETMGALKEVDDEGSTAEGVPPGDPGGQEPDEQG
jgi:hypothetical protein